jgi:Zn-dependent protease with chaperone function
VGTSEPTFADPGAANRTPLGVADVARIVPASAPPPPPTLSYRLALSAVALTGALLALVYFALIAAALGGLAWHVAANSSRIGLSNRDGHMGARTYFGLLVLLAIVIVILVRPLVAAKRAPDVRVAVPRDREPALHAFVERVAKAVGAPLPAEIAVDDEVNATAALRRGLLSFGGNDLVLTLGAPLVAGLSVEQLASVVAHELGHFRQGAGMRLTYVARTLEYWFARAAFERDRWDDGLEKVGRVFGFVQVASWIVRKLFHGMLVLLRAAEAFASRRMETDADDHSLALVGGPACASALREVVLLDTARARAFATVNAEFRHRRLPDDVPALVSAWRSRITDEGAREIVEAALADRTTVAASHPCLRERVERAERVPPGALRCERPAADLLDDPSALFRETTARRYAVDLGDEAAKYALVPAAHALAAEDGSSEERRAFERWSQGAISYLVLPRVGEWLAHVPPPAAAAAGEAQAARDALAAAAVAARAQIAVFDAADTRVIEAHRVAAVLSVRGKTAKMPEVTSIEDRTQVGVAAALAEAEAAQGAARVAIAAAHSAVARRFAAARALLAAGAGDDDVVSLARTLAAADDVYPVIAEVRVRAPATGDLVRELTELENRRADEGFARVAADLRARLAAAHGAAAGGPSGLAEALGALPPDSARPDEVVASVRAALGGFYSWWFETASALAARCEAAESAAGVEPLAAPQ